MKTALTVLMVMFTTLAFAQMKELDVKKIDKDNIEITWEFKQPLQKMSLSGEKIRLQEDILELEERLLKVNELLSKFE